MVPRSRLILIVTFAAFACRRDPSRLDEVQKMAYEVKPAVGRISAYATAQFRYPASSIDAIAGDLGLSRRPLEGEASVETGAGGAGGGFIISSGGFGSTKGDGPGAPQ